MLLLISISEVKVVFFSRRMWIYKSELRHSGLQILNTKSGTMINKQKLKTHERLSTEKAEMKLPPMKTLIGSSIRAIFILDFSDRNSKTFVHALIAKPCIESKYDSGWNGSQKAKQCKLLLRAELATRSHIFPSI